MKLSIEQPAYKNKKAVVVAVMVLAFAAPTVLTVAAGGDVAVAAPNTTYASSGFSAYDWQKDRTLSSGGYDVAGDALTIRVDNTKPSASPGFHRTEGVQTSLASPAHSIKAELLIDDTWGDTPVRAGLWGNGAGYPIIEYANNIDGYTGWRIWDSNGEGGWTRVSAPQATGWHAVEISIHPTTKQVEYYIDNVKIGAFGAQAEQFTGAIVNSFNSATTAGAADSHSVQWRKFQTGARSVDTVAPKVAITAPTANAVLGSESIAIQGTVADAELSHYYITVQHLQGGSWKNVHAKQVNRAAFTTPETLYTLAASAPSGEYRVKLEARDVSGNKSSDSVVTVPFTVDRTAPSVPVITSPTTGQQFDTSVKKITAVWDASSDDSGISAYELKYVYKRNGKTVVDFREVTGDVTQRTQSLSGTVLGDFTIAVRAKDNADNWSEWSDEVTYSYNEQQTPPVDPVDPTNPTNPVDPTDPKDGTTNGGGDDTHQNTTPGGNTTQPSRPANNSTKYPSKDLNKNSVQSAPRSQGENGVDPSVSLQNGPGLELPQSATGGEYQEDTGIVPDLSILARNDDTESKDKQKTAVTHDDDIAANLDDASLEETGDVKGAATENKLLEELANYWWVLLLAGGLSFGWWLLAAGRRRQNDAVFETAVDESTLPPRRRK